MNLTVYVILTIVGGAILIFADILDDVVGGIFNHADAGNGDHAGWFSLKLIAVFVTGFGASGAIAILKGVKGDLVWVTGLGAGLVVAFLVRMVLVWLMRQQGTSHYSIQDLKGKTGRVLTTILPGRIGEVSIRLRETSITKPARAANTREQIEQGTRIYVIDVADDVVIVRQKEESDAR